VSRPESRALGHHAGTTWASVGKTPAVANAGAHPANDTTEFIASTEGRLKLFLLAGYLAEFNPDEWV
jgi:hypothetical protein